MRTKISLALAPRQQLSRQTAWGCLTTNLAVPGFGSLAAGRAVGYAQALLAVGGMALTAVFAARFFYWYMANSSRLQGPESDPFDAFREMWHVIKWPLLGMAIFFIGWLWALATSLEIVRSAKQAESAQEPPRLR